MKKIFFSIICLLSFISFSQAKINLEYEWGKYLPSNIIIAANKIDDGYGIITYNYDNYKKIYVLYDNIGEIIFEKTFEDNHNYYIFNNQIIRFEKGYDFCYQVVMDKKFNQTKKLEIPDCSFAPHYPYGENDKYYFIDYYIFSKETNELIDTYEILHNHELFNEYKNSLSSNEVQKTYKILYEVFKDKYPSTYLTNDFWILGNHPNYQDVFKYYLLDNGYFAIILPDYANENNIVIEFYDVKYNKITSITSSTISNPEVFIKNNKIYLIEMLESNKNPKDAQSNCYFNIAMSEYDFNGNKLNTIDLVDINDQRNYEFGKYALREIFNLTLVSDVFYLTTHKTLNPTAIDPTIGATDELVDIYPSVQKFHFLYNIETKENDNGTINVDKTYSKNGEIVKYKVQPKDGYKLDKVIVTDELGNKIEIKDNSFTMPNANVIIEAIFKVDNPNTSVFVSVVISCLLLLASYVFIVLKNKKVKQYE